MLQSIRERISGVFAAIVGSIAILGCGLLFALYLAPRQKLEARQIESLPVMDASSVSQSNPGDDLLVTGRLVDNPVLLPGEVFVAYKMDVWEVTEADDDPDSPNQEPDGEWKTLERVVPELTVEVNGVSIRTVQADDAYINGPVHETIQRAAGSGSAKYMGDWLSEGSLRVRGFYNSDLVTVWGQKASSGGIIPKELFAGDRVTFIESQHATAKGLLIAGISMMVCSPIVLVVGVLASTFGRRKL